METPGLFLFRLRYGEDRRLELGDPTKPAASRVARLQRALVVGCVSLAGTWALFATARGWTVAALVGATAILCAHAVVLAAEFALLPNASRSDPAPAATPTDLLRAWWAETRAATRVFFWQQPFRSDQWPDHIAPTASGRRGVLLIHGFLCNRGFWNRWLARLRAADIPVVAVNLEPVFGPIEAYSDAIDAAVSRIEHATGQPPIVVAHSMGGLALRRWYAAGPEARIHRAITLGTPHRGTSLARYALSVNGRQMRRGSPWIAALESSENAERATRFICFYSSCDNIVFPPSTATLPGADNRHVPATGHVDLADHPQPWEALVSLMEEDAST